MWIGLAIFGYVCIVAIALAATALVLGPSIVAIALLVLLLWYPGKLFVRLCEHLP